MKKQFFLATIFAVMATISMAQVPYISLSEPIDTSVVTTDSITVGLQQFPGTGSNWHVQPQPQKVGTTTWLQRDTSHYADTYQNLSIGVGNLDAASGYRIRLIIYDDAYVTTDTLYYSEVVTTRPTAQHVQIISVTPVSLLPKSGYKVTGNSIGQPAKVWALNAATFAAVTDTFTFGFMSNYSDTLSFLFDSANMVHPPVRVYMKGLTDNWITSSAVIPGITSPAYTAATMNFGTPVITTKDSVRANLNITSLGNAGNPILGMTITDSLTGLPISQSSQIVTSTGPISISKGSLLSNRWYRINAIVTTPQNMTSTSTLLFKTLNVNPATVTVSQQLPQDYVSYTAKAFIDPKGFSDSSKVVKAELMENNVVVNSSVLALTDTGTITFTQTGQTSGTSKSVKVRVTNGANLVTTSSTINVSMLSVGTPIMNPTTPVKTIDSMYVGFNVTSLGIPLNPTFHVIIKNPAGVIILDSTRLVTSTGIIGIGKGGLLSNTTYTITGTLSNSMMLGDTDIVSVTTNNVNTPLVTIATPVVNYTDYTVTASINSNGSSDSSKVKKVYYYEDNILVDSVSGNVTQVTFTRTNRNQGQSYSGKVKVVNLANLSTTATVSIQMQSLAPNQKPHITDLLADDAATVRVTNITYGASANNTSTIRLVFKILQAGYVDTLTVATGLIGSGIIPEYTINNCIGGYTTEITVIDESPAGIKVGNTLQQNMPLPSDVVLADVTQNNTTGNILSINAFGSGEGNANPTLKLFIFHDNLQIGSMFSTTVSSGMFDYSYSWDNLQPNTQYKVVAELSAIGSASSTMTKYFWTSGVTGIKETHIPEPSQKVRVVNLLGQVITTQEEYRNVCESLKGSQKTVFITPVDSNGVQTGDTKKILIQ